MRIMQLIKINEGQVGKLMYLPSEPLLANVQLGEGTSFSNPLNKCCNCLLGCVCVCVAAEGLTHTRLLQKPMKD